MAAFDTIRASGDDRRAGGLLPVANSLVGTVIGWIEARRTYSQLSALSDRELDDIGLTRGDIAGIANSYR